MKIKDIKDLKNGISLVFDIKSNLGNNYGIKNLFLNINNFNFDDFKKYFGDFDFSNSKIKVNNLKVFHFFRKMKDNYKDLGDLFYTDSNRPNLTNKKVFDTYFGYYDTYLKNNIKNGYKNLIKKRDFYKNLCDIYLDIR